MHVVKYTDMHIYMGQLVTKVPNVQNMFQSIVLSSLSAYVA